MIDVWVSSDDDVQSHLAIAHGRERHVLRRVGEARDDARVLLREKPLRDDVREEDGEPHGEESQELHHELMAEHPAEPSIVEAENSVECAL